MEETGAAGLTKTLNPDVTDRGTLPATPVEPDRGLYSNVLSSICSKSKVEIP